MKHVEAALESDCGVTSLEMGCLFTASEVFKSAFKHLTLPPDNHPARNTCTHQQGHPSPFNGCERRCDWMACSRSAIQDDNDVKKQGPKNSNEASVSFLCLAAVKIKVCSEHAFASDDCTCGIDWAICHSKLALNATHGDHAVRSIQ
jgi:hypothetical protein